MGIESAGAGQVEAGNGNSGVPLFRSTGATKYTMAFTDNNYPYLELPTDKITCNLADAGYFVATIGATDQSPCDAGKYSESKGQTWCFNCPRGTYQPNPASSSCIRASPGYFVDVSGATTQTPCPATFSPSERISLVSVYVPRGNSSTKTLGSAKFALVDLPVQVDLSPVKMVNMLPRYSSLAIGLVETSLVVRLIVFRE